AHRITSPWKWRHLKSVIVPSVQSPPSMLKLHDFCNRAGKGKLMADAVGASVASLCVAESLADLAPCTVVVEAIVEKLRSKCELFQQLEAVVSTKCILATNTSSLSVTAIAVSCAHPGRVADFHFFSPVPLMKIVEVIVGPLTNDDIADALIDIARQMGHTPVRASDTSGFIINYAGCGYLTEPLRLLSETPCAAKPFPVDYR
ncbi:3-hydroxyacyl-CoA dehydrogenase NAD-binding domain-containing protein, partial [Sphingomonas sp. 3P27F8]|uniref:3-hydroxyacyl-CoA dehydrogenase NAD-binding domain-containing protein n=1 Tax=Sphingomonas sp. 3P27F8 TaxID=2502213 RepID=UPI002016941E